jgi:hypothetical protein
VGTKAEANNCFPNQMFKLWGKQEFLSPVSHRLIYYIKYEFYHHTVPCGLEYCVGKKQLPHTKNWHNFGRITGFSSKS